MSWDYKKHCKVLGGGRKVWTKEDRSTFGDKRLGQRSTVYQRIWSRVCLENFIVRKIVIEMSLQKKKKKKEKRNEFTRLGPLWIALLFYPLSVFFFFFLIELRVFPLCNCVPINLCKCIVLEIGIAHGTGLCWRISLKYRSPESHLSHVMWYRETLKTVLWICLASLFPCNVW